MMSLQHESRWRRPEGRRWGRKPRSLMVSAQDKRRGLHDREKSSQSLVRLKSNMRVLTLDESLHSTYGKDTSVSSSNATQSTAALTVCSMPFKSVNWGSITIREYERIVCENPSCSCGPPIGIGWKYNETSLSVEDHEISHPTHRTTTEMLLPRALREEILMEEWGIPRSVVASAVRKNVKAKGQRRRTVNNINDGTERVEFFVESTVRKMKRVFCCQPRSSTQIRMMQNRADRSASVIGTLSDSSFDEFMADESEGFKSSVPSSTRSLDDSSLRIRLEPDIELLPEEEKVEKVEKVYEAVLDDEERKGDLCGDGTVRKDETVEPEAEEVENVSEDTVQTKGVEKTENRLEETEQSSGATEGEIKRSHKKDHKKKIRSHRKGETEDWKKPSQRKTEERRKRSGETKRSDRRREKRENVSDAAVTDGSCEIDEEKRRDKVDAKLKRRSKRKQKVKEFYEDLDEAMKVAERREKERRIRKNVDALSTQFASFRGFVVDEETRLSAGNLSPSTHGRPCIIITEDE